MKDYVYTVELVIGTKREQLGQPTRDIRAARRKALSVKQTLRRKTVIMRDGKELPGGPHGLDREALDRWFEDAEKQDIP